MAAIDIDRHQTQLPAFAWPLSTETIVTETLGHRSFFHWVNLSRIFRPFHILCISFTSITLLWENLDVQLPEKLIAQRLGNGPLHRLFPRKWVTELYGQYGL